MSLKIIADKCKWTEDMSSGLIVVESDNGRDFAAAIEELKSPEARNAALRYATTAGVADPRINGMIPHPYPVNSQGLSLEDVKGDDGKPVKQTHPLMQPVKYRSDFPVCKRLV